MLSFINADVYKKISIALYKQKKNKPLGPVAESPSWLVSASLDSAEDGEAKALVPSNKRRNILLYGPMSHLKWMPLDKGTWHNGWMAEFVTPVSPLH